MRGAEAALRVLGKEACAGRGAAGGPPGAGWPVRDRFPALWIARRCGTPHRQLRGDCTRR